MADVEKPDGLCDIACNRSCLFIRSLSLLEPGGIFSVTKENTTGGSRRIRCCIWQRQPMITVFHGSVWFLQKEDSCAAVGGTKEPNKSSPPGRNDHFSAIVEQGKQSAPAVFRSCSSFVSQMIASFVPSLELAMSKLQTADEQHGSLAKRVALYLVPPSGAAITFGATLFAAQAAGAAAGISCATPVLASVVGCVALCGASAASAQASHGLRKFYSQKSFQREESFLSKESILVNVLFGVFAFKVLGGSYCNLMPSNVINPGALARVSIPARGSKYANSGEQGVIQDLFRKHGCHHCGKRSGTSIADHMPPNVVVHGRGWATSRLSTQKSFLDKLASSMHLYHIGIGSKIVHQRFYPQCTDCMKMQSAALRHGKKTLVLHFKRGIPEAPFFAGFSIGAMQLNEITIDGDKNRD